MWFVNIHTIEDLDAEYVKLVRQYHPDLHMGCSDGIDYNAITQEINAAYDQAKTRMGGDGCDRIADTIAQAVAVACGLDGVDVEICGSWVWLSGNTYPHRETLKANGFLWSRNKERWHYAAKRSRSRGKYDMNQIRDMYGSVWANSRQAIAS